MTGKFSFDTFTHSRASMDVPSWMDKLLGKRYPPYTVSSSLTRLDAHQTGMKDLALMNYSPLLQPANLEFFRKMLTPRLPPRDGVSSSRRWWKRLGLAALVSAVLCALRLSGKAKVA